MSMPGRLLMITSAVAGGLASAQFPEFAQQYRQRLGGAVAELRQVVEDFERDASRNGLTRQQALLTFEASGEAFLRDRGATMAFTLSRYDWLLEQQARLQAAQPITRPLVVLSGPDRRVLAGAWEDFEPALPMTRLGLVWGLTGFLIGGALAWFIRFLVGTSRRRARHKPHAAAS